MNIWNKITQWVRFEIYTQKEAGKIQIKPDEPIGHVARVVAACFDDDGISKNKGREWITLQVETGEKIKVSVYITQNGTNEGLKTARIMGMNKLNDAESQLIYDAYDRWQTRAGVGILALSAVSLSLALPAFEAAIKLTDKPERKA